MDIQTRIAMERDIVKRILEAFPGFEFRLDDGEELTKLTSDHAVIMEEVQSTDEQWIIVYKDGKVLGTIFLVYGNDGYDVICDYHCCLEKWLEPVNKYTDELAEKEYE